MAVNLATVRCNDQVVNARLIQRQILMRLLCQLQNALGGVIDCTDEDALVAAADAEGLLCKSAAENRRLQMQIICETLEIDCSSTICLSEEQLEAVITYLIAQIMDILVP